uniref:Lactamase_B domain-containing protein n=1 Tax=Ascaris lumbricoides TaxID=6252 RepID=A0A0M3IUS4_ASCLU
MEEIFVEQLLVGYANESTINKGYFTASGSVTVIIDGNRKILVDCGNPWNGEALLSALQDNALSTSEITDLIITHGHIDHCGNMCLFTTANIYMDRDLARPYSEYTTFEDGFEITKNVRILRTPGHTDNDLSVIVYNTKRGCVAITGDIFEDENPDNWEPNSRYVSEQKRSRSRILAIADWIIPGHGAIFRNKFKTIST